MRCKPGDLAVIVRPRHQENLGALIEVLHIEGDHDGEPLWWVRSLGGPLVRGVRTRSLAYEGRIRDSALRPIRPDADPVETETEREVTA